MKNINWPLFLIGLAVAAVAVGGLLFLGTLLYPAPTQIPVAVHDIPAGTTLDRANFRLEEWIGVRPQTLGRLFTAREFPQDAVTLVDVPAGSPLYRAAVDTETAGAYVTRLTHLLDDPTRVLVAIPVKPEIGGNMPRRGDEVDLLLALGSLRTNEVQNHPTVVEAPQTGAPRAPEGPTFSRPVLTGTLPLATLVLQNIPVVHIEREQVTTGYSTSPGGGATPQTAEGDVQRIYVSVTRAQAELLSFVLHSGAGTGAVRLAAHAPGLAEHYPGGLLWEDFETWLFERRAAQNKDWRR